MSSDIYKVDGPALISFSGGRTSGYMLFQILEAYGGSLPDDVHVIFANTGKERPETLDFVSECAQRWSVEIIWLEYRDTETGYEIVDHNSASRQGEPFSALIQKRGYLPNPVTRFCTAELKIRVMKRWMINQGYYTWWNIVGIRADERGRVARMRKADIKERWDNLLPLADDGITHTDVLAFWRDMPFDLGIFSAEGNCDCCFLKGQKTLQAIMRTDPSLAAWWEAQEKQQGATFRIDRPTYRDLNRLAQDQGDFAWPMDDGTKPCMCHD